MYARNSIFDSLHPLLVFPVGMYRHKKAIVPMFEVHGQEQVGAAQVDMDNVQKVVMRSG